MLAAAAVLACALAVSGTFGPSSPVLAQGKLPAYRAQVHGEGKLLKGDGSALGSVIAGGTFYQLGKAWRLDVLVKNGQLVEPTTIIFDPAGATFYVLHPDTLTGTSYTQDEMKKRARNRLGALDPVQSIAAASDLAKRPGATKLGKRTIAGLACEGYRLKSGDARVTLWMHEGLLIPVSMESRSGGGVLTFKATNVEAGADVTEAQFKVPSDFTISKSSEGAAGKGK